MPLLILLLLCFTTPLQAKVYQTVDEHGNVMFTDKPEKGAIERKVRQPTVIPFKSAKPAKQKNESQAEPAVKKKAEPKPYSLIKITQPVNDNSIWENAGEVRVQVTISPPLQTQFGHSLRVKLDERWLPTTYTAPSFTLHNVDRGWHKLKVAIVDGKGSRIKESAEITFYLHRASVLFR